METRREDVGSQRDYQSSLQSVRLSMSLFCQLCQLQDTARELHPSDDRLPAIYEEMCEIKLKMDENFRNSK